MKMHSGKLFLGLTWFILGGREAMSKKFCNLLIFHYYFKIGMLPPVLKGNCLCAYDHMQVQCVAREIW